MFPPAYFFYFTTNIPTFHLLFIKLLKFIYQTFLYAAVCILTERFLLYRKAISCKVKKDLQNEVTPQS